MKLDVAAQLRLPGSSGESHIEAPIEPIAYGGQRIDFAEPVSIDVNYSFDGSAFAVEGSAGTVLLSQCALCTAVFREPFAFTFSERFERLPGEESDSYPFSGNELELSEMITDNILLNIPMSSRCREDCKGLCPVCGCDLNKESCSCGHEAEDEKSPFSALGALLDNDKEV